MAGVRNARGLAEKTRAMLFALVIITSGILITLVQLLMLPISMILDRSLFVVLRVSLWLIDHCIVAPFFNIKTVGLEKLRGVTGPAVIVSNHQSTIDAFSFGAIGAVVNFRVTFKRELLFVPGIGSALYFSGHVPVKRGDKSSAQNLFERCAAYLRSGVWIIFFPEGTRKIDPGSKSPMGPFKAGAFKLAKENGVPLVPVTISGARTLFPTRGFPSLGFGQVTVTVHDPIPTAGREVDELMRETHDAIAQALQPCDMLPPAKPAAAEGVKEE